MILQFFPLLSCLSSSPSSWLAIFATCLSFALAMRLTQSPSSSVLSNLSSIFRSLLLLGPDASDGPTPSSRGLWLSLGLFSFLIYSFYTADLTSSLTAVRAPRKIQGRTHTGWLYQRRLRLMSSLSLHNNLDK